MKVCSRCMAENAEEAKFCKLCASVFQQGGTKMCPRGIHTMDPSWTECIYCKAETASGGVRSSSTPPLPPRPTPRPPYERSRTVVESETPPSVRQPNRSPTQHENAPLQAVPGIWPASGGSAASAAPAPVPDPKPASPPSRKTVYGGSALTPVPSVVKGRKIVGLLVTYSWVPEGKIYEIREGRNLIGRDPKCEICVPEDETLSSVNSHITYRQSFSIGDMVSMMGTDLDGVPVDQFYYLNNFAVIRAGSTYFTFLAIQQTASTAPAES